MKYLSIIVKKNKKDVTIRLKICAETNLFFTFECS